MKISYIIGISLLILTYLLFLGIISALADKRFGKKKQKEYVFFCSKILTIKNLLALNHQSAIFYRILPSGEIEGLETNYNNLLKLIKNNECVEGYRQCGILDSIGNKLCIDESFDCPINKIKVDLISKESVYLSNNYENVRNIKNLSYNYQLYFSNQFIDGNCANILIKDNNEPKYITMNNFIIDQEAYKQIFGDYEILGINSFDLFGTDSNKNNNNDNNKEETEDLIVGLIKLATGDEAEGIAKAAIPLLSYASNKQMEDFSNYVKTRLEEDISNIDNHYTHLGDNFYSKNYIGFKNNQELTKFMKYDFDIYKKVFPNRIAAIFAISLLIVNCLLMFSPLILCFDDKGALFTTVCFCSIVYLIMCLGFFIYSIVIYFKVNKNKKLDELKSIASDEFINNFINEFIELCTKSYFLIKIIYMIGISLLIHLIGFILSFFI